MNFDFLADTALFKDVSPSDLKSMLHCLEAEEKSYEKGSTILHAGNPVSVLGIVLSGRISVENDDPWGNKSILDSLGPGFVFAETYACIPEEPMMVNVVASEAAAVLFLKSVRIFTTCPMACPHHRLLIRNLLTICARKNLNLSRRIFNTSSKSIRGRLLSYLSFQAARNQCRDFTIPFNRQQLADYLSVDRSALSAELGKMQKEGLLTVKKNHFVLHEADMGEA